MRTTAFLPFSMPLVPDFVVNRSLKAQRGKKVIVTMKGFEGVHEATIVHIKKIDGGIQVEIDMPNECIKQLTTEMIDLHFSIADIIPE